MLSQPTTRLHARQKQHRRQNSTPSAFEGVKMPALPNSSSQRQAAGHQHHRRGLSLDTRRQHHQQDHKQQQQQQQQQQHHSSQQHYASALASSDSENYLISPRDTPQSHRFDPASCFDAGAVPFGAYDAQLSLMMQKNQESYSSNMTDGKEFDLYTNDSALSTPTFMHFPDSPSGQGWSSEGASRRGSRRISNGIAERVTRFESMSMEELQRPMTPPNQNGSHQFPPTPMETPHDRLVKQETRPDRFSDDYDESMEETIKPRRAQSSQRTQNNIFQEMRQQAEGSSTTVPNSPRSGGLPVRNGFVAMPMQGTDFMGMSSLRNEFARMDRGFGQAKYEEPESMHSGASEASHHSTPAEMGNYMGGFDETHGLQHMVPEASPSGSPSRRKSPHRRTESIASMTSAASIASINIEETKTETGVTMEEISQFIRGPETTDGKWTCLFEDCGKVFGRKENIKSHVQTHLNDRQYQCPTCHKCFVRQHDLKRHAKIHTGIKPYPCECGNSFARHDALTRHRQRGMCIGAFDGIVRKVVKRGRPRKNNRPDMDTRLEKSARQRKKNMSISSVGSVSEFTDSSCANTPEYTEYNMFNDVDPAGMARGLPASSSAPMPLMSATSSAVVPSSTSIDMADMAMSPEAESVHSYVSPEAVMERTISKPPTPAGSLYTTPPDLSRSSSPPPAHFFDVDPNTSASTDACDLAAMSAPMAEALAIGINDHDDDLLLQFGSDDSVQLDRGADMLMMGKFDDDFDNVGMFGGDDMFFGSAA
ncbi:C2H2 transcription factor Swi5 [Purpureocillium lavendulum]|uniref:C2H2 transcription factor Swi5 n=1 Tax=Purpureocillium lavendulum TaxID=1247861 RepID=A0AB34FRK4_9HYPO|nr:C2H2 transcription factor Swi5 [Purpureocillium lavendulum]